MRKHLWLATYVRFALQIQHPVVPFSHNKPFNYMECASPEGQQNQSTNTLEKELCSFKYLAYAENGYVICKESPVSHTYGILLLIMINLHLNIIPTILLLWTRFLHHYTSNYVKTDSRLTAYWMLHYFT